MSCPEIRYEGHHISSLILRDLGTKPRLINGICGAIERVLVSKSISVNLDCGHIWAYVKETRPRGLLDIADREKGVLL